MNRLVLIGSLIIVISCGAREGDIYEHEISKDRIEILDVGRCVDVYNTRKARNEYSDTARSGSKKQKMRRGYIKSIYPLYQDSSATCVGFDEKERHPVYDVITTNYRIVEEDGFLRDHIKIK